MRTFLLLVFLIAAGVFLFRNHQWFPPASKPPATVVATTTPSPTPTPAGPEALTEDTYITFGMPPLNSDWDAAGLKSVTAALQRIKEKRPRALPGPDTEYGRAFFTKLRYTITKFHLLSSENKVASYNAFSGIFNTFSTPPAGRTSDREMALLIGLQCELMVGAIEDPDFVKDTKAIKARTMRGLDERTFVYTPGYMHFKESIASMTHDLENYLRLVGDSTTFRPEARALALSRISLHLPTIAQRLEMKNFRPILAQNRAKEPDPVIRAQYDALILKTP